MKKRSDQSWKWIVLIIGLLALLAMLFWMNYQYTSSARGPNEFLKNWMGYRGFLTQGLNPYSEERMLAIQMAAYNRPAVVGEPDLRLSQPLFAIAIYWPFALIPDFAIARALWMVILETALVALAFISVRLMNWKPGFGTLSVFFLFTLLWYHGLQPLLQGSEIILIALVMTSALLALRSGGDELAGVLLAFAMIRPSAVILPVLYTILWAMKHRRTRLVTWFGATLLLLIATSLLLMPDWILENLRSILRPESFHFPDTPEAVMNAWLPAVGSRLGIAFSALVSIILLVEWYLGLRAEFRGFLWTYSLTLVLGQWCGIPGGVDQFIIMLPVLALVFSLLGERWRAGGELFSLVTMVILLAAFWGIYFSRTGRTTPQVAILLFALPLVLLVMLYWVRWWAFRPPYLWFDGLSSSENLKF